MGRSMGHWHWQWRPSRAADRLPLLRWPRADRQAAALHSPEAPVSMCNERAIILTVLPKRNFISQMKKKKPWWEKMSPCECRLMVDGPAVVMAKAIWKKANRPSPKPAVECIFLGFFSLLVLFLFFSPQAELTTNSKNAFLTSWKIILPRCAGNKYRVPNKENFRASAIWFDDLGSWTKFVTLEVATPILFPQSLYSRSI